MKQEQQTSKLHLPGTILFVVVNLMIILTKASLTNWGIQYEVVVVGNALLYFLYSISLLLHKKAASNKNPNVLVRSIMGSMLIKMMVIGLAAITYLLVSKVHRNIPAICIIMVLYVFYLVLEVRASYALNKKTPTDASK
jgi:hypothetical protein